MNKREMSVENQARESPDGGVVQQAEVNNTIVLKTTSLDEETQEDNSCENM
jgi:hypothetical protein